MRVCPPMISSPGRRPKMDALKIRQARLMYDDGDVTVRQVAETFGVSRGTIYRYLRETQRIMAINKLSQPTPEAVDAARNTLLIGN